MKDSRLYKEPSGITLASIVESELKLREAVKELNIDTPLVRDFLQRTANEFIKFFKIKGKIKNIFPADFCFEISAENYYGPHRIRVPIIDFFKGNSQIAQQQYSQQQILASSIEESRGKKEARPVPKSRHTDTREARKTAANSRSPKQRKLAKD